MHARHFTSAHCALGATLALICLITPAVAQEQPPKWMVHADRSLVVIAYQVPDSDDVRFHIDCDNKSKIARLTVFDEVKRTRAGQPITIDVANGSDKISLRGKTTTDELNGYVYVQASRITLGPLLALLSRAGEVTARAKTASMKVPDTGRAEAVREFGAKCSLR